MISTMGGRRLVSALLAGAGLAGFALAGSSAPALADHHESTTTNLYWGDVHLHSNYSLDAYATGNTNTTPDMAYRFARGIPIAQPGLDRKVQIRRPLDFMSVTDHAEFLGLQVMVGREDPTIVETPWGQKALEAHRNDPIRGAMSVSGGALTADTPEQREKNSQLYSDKVRSAAWSDIVDAGQRNYRPGTFTTLMGWEWTSMTPAPVKNLHRIVVTDAGANAKEFIPFSNMDSMKPEDLWAWMAKTKERTGIDLLAIPHNSNISGGLMFGMTDSDGKPFSPAYARMRATWEPLVEMTQAKGTSEVHPELSPNDEFADFEIRRKLLAGEPTPADKGDYARSALLRGLQFQSSIGANPYKFGMIGSTDSHTSMSSVQETDYTGKIVTDMNLSDHKPGDRFIIFPAWEMGASGRVAAWASENTREGIFSAFKRKEVYATTGTRIALRVFGGFNFAAADADAMDIAAVGYAKGIPMGGDLTNAPAGQAPQFLIHAAKDPISGNLDRVQVVKGWVDAAGETHEEVFDVVWSGARDFTADGALESVGNTVDLRTGLYTNTIGAVQLSTVWTDPGFDPSETAFYYVRVLEIPTPRHSLLDALALGMNVADTRQPATIQERAYSSPIWYTPAR